MSEGPVLSEAETRLMRRREEFFGILVVGAILGIWHAGLGGRAIFTFRNDEPVSSWVAMLFGSLSTLPAVVLALFSRPWSAIWLIAGGLISLGAFLAGAVTSGYPARQVAETCAFFLMMVSGPMVLLGLGLIWAHSRLQRLGDFSILKLSNRRTQFLVLIVSSYLLLSIGALFVAEVPLFMAMLNTPLGLCAILVVLGPLATLATARLIGLPIYLIETVVVFGLVWLALTGEKRRRASLIGAVSAWLISGLLFWVIVFAGS